MTKFRDRIKDKREFVQDGALTDEQLENVFSTATKSPWSEAPYANAELIGTTRGLSLDGFLSKWALMTRLHPIYSAKNLLYIGYTGELFAALKVTRRITLDRKK
nr:mitochondrial Rho GTPase 1 [Tanacetum cinerariifolium]